MSPELSFRGFSFAESNLDLHLESTLSELELDNFQIDSHCLSKEVAGKFEENPLLPGVILTEYGQLIGMISRRRFLERMSRPYGLELFLQRTLKSLYHFVKTDILTFSGDTLIVAAARQALARVPNLLSEPIIVEIAPLEYRLLDVYQLLIAQSKIHELATTLLTQLYQELATANLQLQRLATLDGLTEVANRRKFDEYLTQQWQQLAQEQKPLSLILCDVDYFKKFNDTYGHQVGDDCLKKIAATITTTLNQIIPEDLFLVARYGGEEFSVILPKTPIKQALQIAENIRKKVKQLQIPHRDSCCSSYVTLSLGVATLIPHSAEATQTIIKLADVALYQGKEAGRDRVIAYSPSLLIPQNQ
ncbi:MAG: GGDEF domain-containing protein [Oscillatoria sp. PMC 1068.18]|nr:GGDEF domain-containing protein [Oscillatoria sp. PMC 1076.18]MEC4990621.1 GGDEF domain-containing protein [Oscillatoria sp. PMC 1068.18]